MEIGMGFDEAFEVVLGHEGGFQNHRSDRGNWTGGKVGVGVLKGTKFGVSAAAHPDLDIPNLTISDVKPLYRRDYWGPAGCDAVPDPLKKPLFDLAVHSGPGRAARLLQRAVGAVEDGSIGPRTLMAISNMPVDRVLRRLDAHRLLLMANDPTFIAFGKGWVIRVATNALETS
jgi:lysozyme family protein